VEPPAEPPVEPAAEPAAPPVVDLAGDEAEAGGGVHAPPVEPPQVAPPAAAPGPAPQVQAAAGPPAAPLRHTRSGRAGVAVPVKKPSTKVRAKRAVTLPMPEAFIPTPMGITPPAEAPILTSVAPSVPIIPVSTPIIPPPACVPMVSAPIPQPTPMQVEPPQVPLAQPMDISPTQVAATQAPPVVCTTGPDAGQVPVSMLMSPQRAVPRVTVLMTGPTLYGTLAGLVSPVPEPVAVPQPVQPSLTSTPGLAMPTPTPSLGRTSTGHVGLPPIPTPVDISALPPLPSAQPLSSTLSGLDLLMEAGELLEQEEEAAAQAVPPAGADTVMETLSSPPPSGAAGDQGTQVPEADVSGVAEEAAAPLPQVSAGVPADEAGAPEASGPVPGAQEMPAGPSQPTPSATGMISVTTVYVAYVRRVYAPVSQCMLFCLHHVACTFIISKSNMVRQVCDVCRCSCYTSSNRCGEGDVHA
jgi:hypothetical protein